LVAELGGASLNNIAVLILDAEIEGHEVPTAGTCRNSVPNLLGFAKNSLLHLWRQMSQPEEHREGVVVPRVVRGTCRLLGEQNTADLVAAGPRHVGERSA